MKKTCFVIQGFHEKQDYPTGRTLNLDASYDVIREAVTEAGLECVRADEIRHSGTIDKPMFEQILGADLVIADLSTYNVNAAYELGVRHALRPYTTIIVAESKLSNPFDFSHIVIQRYEHLGPDLGRREAQRFKDELKKSIAAIVGRNETDSPVYTFVTGLQPPTRPADPAVPGAARVAAPAEPSLKERMDRARAAIAKDDFAGARIELLALKTDLEKAGARDDAVTQQLALATYKSKKPTAEAALEEAKGYLLTLDPMTSHDTETLGLWGAVHKRFWDLRKDPAALEESIRGYERGYQLRQDYYNGINYAFLLNVRSQQTRNTNPAESIADWVLAERVRRRVIEQCKDALAKLPEITAATPANEADKTREQQYWILSTLREAAVGLGDAAGADDWQAKSMATQPKGWMIETTAGQIARLEALLADPPTRLLKP
jgi:hypothetical protein